MEVHPHVEPAGCKVRAQRAELREAIHPRDAVVDARVRLDAEPRQLRCGRQVAQRRDQLEPRRRALLEAPVHALALALGVGEHLAERRARILLQVPLKQH